MGSAIESTSEPSNPEQQASGAEQQPAGHSGEGAASALAHLKTQTRQHRRQAEGASDEPAQA